MSVVRRLASVEPDEPDTWIDAAVVTNIAAGTTPDGRRLIKVRWRETEMSCSYLASYTPVLNDVVTFLKAGPSVLVIGKPARA